MRNLRLLIVLLLAGLVLAVGLIVLSGGDSAPFDPYYIFRYLFVGLFTALICGIVLLILGAIFSVVLAWSSRIMARSIVAIRRNVRIMAGWEANFYQPLFKDEGEEPPEE